MIIGDDSLFSDALEQKRAMRAAFTEPDDGDIEPPVQSNFNDSLDLEDTQLPFGDPAVTTGADCSDDDQNHSQDITGFNAYPKNETGSDQVVNPTPDICGGLAVTAIESSALKLESSMTGTTDNMAAQSGKRVLQFGQKKRPMFGSSKSTQSKNTAKPTTKVNSSPSDTLGSQPPAQENTKSLLPPCNAEQSSNKENQGNNTDQCVPQNGRKKKAPLNNSFTAPKPKFRSKNKVPSSDKERENKNKSQDKKSRKEISETECDENEEMEVELEEERVDKKKERNRKLREAEEKDDGNKKMKHTEKKAEREWKKKEAEGKNAENERKKKETEEKKAEKERKKEEAGERKAERERLKKESREKKAEGEKLKKERQIKRETKKAEHEQKENDKKLEKSKRDREKKKEKAKCIGQEKSSTAPEISNNTDCVMNEKETNEPVPAQGGKSEAMQSSRKIHSTDTLPLTPETESHTPTEESATSTSCSVSQSSIHSVRRSRGKRGKEGVTQPEEYCGLPESSNLPVRSAREEGMPEEDRYESEDEVSQSQPGNIAPLQQRANTENMGNKQGEVVPDDRDRISEDEKETNNFPEERASTATSEDDRVKEENKTEYKNEAREENEGEEGDDTVPAVEPGSKKIRIVFGKSQTARSKVKLKGGNGKEGRGVEEGKDGGNRKGNQEKERKSFKVRCTKHPPGIAHHQREIKSSKAPCTNQPLGKKEAKTLSKDQNRQKKTSRARKRKAESIDDEPSGSTESRAKCSRSHNYCGPVWVQCEQPHCLKWRQVSECSDPLSLPDSWTCSMNPGRPALIHSGMISFRTRLRE